MSRTSRADGAQARLDALRRDLMDNPLIAELLARISVLTAGTPVASARLPAIARTSGAARVSSAPRRTLGVRRLPEFSAREPSQDHVLVRAFQLMKRRQQLLLIARAEGRRFSIDQDRPVREARRHRW